RLSVVVIKIKVGRFDSGRQFVAGSDGQRRRLWNKLHQKMTELVGQRAELWEEQAERARFETTAPQLTDVEAWQLPILGFKTRSVEQSFGIVSSFLHGRLADLIEAVIKPAHARGV